MVYHDQINRGSYSSRLEDTAAYQHQLRRIGSHPSLVAFSMCNECFPWAGGGIVPQLVSLVVSEDDSRPVWPACPAQGWRSGVNRLTGLPNGEKFAMYDASTWGPVSSSHTRTRRCHPQPLPLFLTRLPRVSPLSLPVV